MDFTERENTELAGDILAGKMRNAWEDEDRANQPDTRPPNMRQNQVLHRAPSYYDNYDLIDWSK